MPLAPMRSCHLRSSPVTIGAMDGIDASFGNFTTDEVAIWFRRKTATNGAGSERPTGGLPNCHNCPFRWVYVMMELCHRVVLLLRGVFS